MLANKKKTCYHNEMRLVESSGSQALAHATFGRRPIKDMRALYGGNISRAPALLDGGRQRSLRAAGGRVIGFTQGRRATETLVGIKDLQLPESAAHWTALQAYRARGGAAFEYLHTEVPGVRGYEEWSNRRLKASREQDERDETALREAVEKLIPDANISEEEFEARLDALYNQRDVQQIARLTQSLDFLATTSAGSGNSQMERFFAANIKSMAEIIDAMEGMEVALSQGDDTEVTMAVGAYVTAATARSREVYDLPEKLPHTHTEFYAKGHSLPVAARVMAVNYGDLLFHADDPEVAVANALGASSLDRLDLVWDQAMDQRSPLAAGQFVLQSLIK